MMRMLLAILLALWIPIGAGAVTAVQTEHVDAHLIPEKTRIAPGERMDLALVFDLIPDWHTYWRNPGDSGEPPKIEWTLPDGVAVGSLRFPYPELIRVGPLANYGYADRVVHLITVELAPDVLAGRTNTLEAEAKWLVCREECIPEAGTFTLQLETVSEPVSADPTHAGLFATAEARMPVPYPGRVYLEPTDSGMALRLDGDLPNAVNAAWFFAGDWGQIEHAAPQQWSWGDDQAIVELTPAEVGSTTEIEGAVVFDTDDGRVAYQVGPITLSEPLEAPQAEAASLGLPVALAFALLGGVILNLMPCVFPVLAIKALSFTQHGQQPLGKRLLHGTVYTAGVIGFFALMGIGLLALRAGGNAVGWGFQLQYPPFVASMGILFFVLGLSLSGAVTFGNRLMGLAGSSRTSGLSGAFITGALAALVAAPCTAPFMGAALGYAVTLPTLAALAIVSTLGLGLALPYLILVLMPAVSKRLPRPGPWMETVKQLLAFPLYGTSVWLVWVLAVQTGASGVAAVLTAAVLIAFGLWTWERARLASPGLRLVGGATLAAALLAGLVLIVSLDSNGGSPGAGAADEGEGRWQPYTEQALADALATGRPVFVNMTAAWCITCLVNERVALETQAVVTAFEANDLIYLKGDWTDRDPEITRYLAEFGRTGVPIYVLYRPGEEPRVLPQILSESIILNALAAG